MLHFYPLNELISNVMPATVLKKAGTKGKKHILLKKDKCWEVVSKHGSVA